MERKAGRQAGTQSGDGNCGSVVAVDLCGGEHVSDQIFGDEEHESIGHAREAEIGHRPGHETKGQERKGGA